MSRWHKKSSGRISGSALLCKVPCRYFGFELITGGSNRQFTAYDGINENGKIIEDLLCDGNKPTDGHSHASPVMCNIGLYVVIATGATAVIWYYDEIQ